jgi:copper resistance protein C
LVSGPTLSKALITSDKNGIYKVEYRAVAADGHVIKGEFTFTVDPSGVTTAEIKVDPFTSTSPDAENKLSIYLILSVTAIIGGLLVLIFIWKRQVK